MNRVFIKTYGCQMNERDSEAVAAMLRARGYSIVDCEEDADTILLNTCSVRDQAERKAIGKAGYILSRKRKKGNVKVGIMGCMAQNRGQDLIEKLPDLDLLVGTQKFHRIPQMLDQLLESERALGPNPSTLIDIDPEEGSQNEIKDHLKERGLKPSAFVSIMQGCNMRCNFCIVPKTRGEERCRSIESILEEVQQLVENGTKEVTLLGQIVTSYGRREIGSKNGKTPFVQLIEAIAELKGIERIRFTSPHPRGFKDDLIEAFRDIPKLMPFVHLPVQSGSDRMLKLMNRPYSSDRYKQIIDDLRAVVPDMYFCTDIIVGHPGESDEDFRMTKELFEYVKYDMAYIFKYSPRSQTPSADMEDDVSTELKDLRNQELLELLEKYSRMRNDSMVGSVQQVLVENPAKRGENMWSGRNPGNRKVIFEGDASLKGKIIPVKINEASLSSLMGDLIRV